MYIDRYYIVSAVCTLIHTISSVQFAQIREYAFSPIVLYVDCNYSISQCKCVESRVRRRFRANGFLSGTIPTALGSLPLLSCLYAFSLGTRYYRCRSHLAIFGITQPNTPNNPNSPSSPNNPDNPNSPPSPNSPNNPDSPNSPNNSNNLNYLIT